VTDRADRFTGAAVRGAALPARHRLEKAIGALGHDQIELRE
jgi:hypothetical protein